MNAVNTEKRKTLTIYEATFTKLQRHGRFGESWDDVLSRLADNAAGEAKIQV